MTISHDLTDFHDVSLNTVRGEMAGHFTGSGNFPLSILSMRLEGSFRCDTIVIRDVAGMEADLVRGVDVYYILTTPWVPCHTTHDTFINIIIEYSRFQNNFIVLWYPIVCISPLFIK